MTATFYSTPSLVIPANGVLPLPFSGTFLVNLSSTMAAGTLKITIDGGQESRFDAYDAFEALQGTQFSNLVIRNTTGASITFTLGVANGKISTANATTIVGNVSVALIKGTTIQDTPDVTLTNGAETLLLAAFATRRSATIVSDPANTVNIRIGKTGTVGAARGPLLAPGQTFQLQDGEYTGAIYGYAAAAGQKVSLVEFGD
jgi:hypothetical protein